MDWTVSYWPNRFAKEPSDAALSSIADLCRANHRLRDMDKLRLPAITAAGLFRGRRTLDGLVKPSGLVFVDIDAKTQRVAIDRDHFEAACSSPYAVMVKRSLSCGLHVLINADGWQDARRHIENLTDLETDPLGGPQPNSLCFLSWHPSLYFNAEPRRMLATTPPPPLPLFAQEIGDDQLGREIAFCESVLEKKGFGFTPGGQNSFLYRLSLMLRDRGFSEGSISPVLTAKYGDDRTEKIVSNAYRYAKN